MLKLQKALEELFLKYFKNTLRCESCMNSEELAFPRVHCLKQMKESVTYLCVCNPFI